MSSFEDQAIKAGEAHLNTKIDTLAELLIEIKEEDYTTVHQIKGAIRSRIEVLISFKDNAE